MAPSFYFEEDPGRWNRMVSDCPDAHIMQTWDWGMYKSHLGWQPYRLAVQDDGRNFAGAQILLKTLPLTGWRIGYIPKGPLISLKENRLWESMCEGFRTLGQQNNIVVIRSEPNYVNHPQVREQLSRFGFRQTVQTNQPRCTFFVDLSEGENDVFAQLNRNVRRLINKAEREGVTVEESDDQGVRIFYQQLLETSRRKRIPLQSQSFYQEAFRAFAQDGHVKLFLARFQDQAVSSLMVFFYQKCSMHLWAGNSGLGLQSNASYLLHWTAMKTAMARGCTLCDLWGIPDDIAGIVERGETVSRKRCDGLWGVYRFKEGFGGQIRCFVGTYDFVLRPGLYWMMQRLMSGQQTMDRVSNWLYRFS
ncbi:peptidoglycan bridge formation glycyltransferase FemA/FemB family protein [bacterium]|nr:peptidoglycan bridge formation glycyltransferase FemA/FemB family protein [bacterium]